MYIYNHLISEHVAFSNFLTHSGNLYFLTDTPSQLAIEASFGTDAAKMYESTFTKEKL